MRISALISMQGGKSGEQLLHRTVDQVEDRGGIQTEDERYRDQRDQDDVVACIRVGHLHLPAIRAEHHALERVEHVDRAEHDGSDCCEGHPSADLPQAVEHEPLADEALCERQRDRVDHHEEEERGKSRRLQFHAAQCAQLGGARARLHGANDVQQADHHHRVCECLIDRAVDAIAVPGEQSSAQKTDVAQ